MKFSSGLVAIALVFAASAAESEAPAKAKPARTTGPVPEPAAADARELPLSTEPWGADVFHDRRRRLMSQMKGGVALVLSANRTDNIGGLRQDADFLYLTGLADESEAALLLAPQEPQPEMLFLAPLNPERERWIGFRAALPNRAVELRTGFAKVQRTNTMGAIFADVARRQKEMQFFGPVVGYDAPMPKVLEIYTKTKERAVGSRVQDAVGMLARMRSIKEPRELEKMARATEITVDGHLEAIRRVKPGMREWELKQILEDAFRKAGGRQLAYEPILGAGPDGCLLHYPGGDRVIQDGELVLIDAAAEFDHYASDVTRTFPANGKFTAEQRNIYDVVLRAQRAALKKVRPGVTWDELQETASKVIADAGYYNYFIHRLGHFVGLEVHDAGVYAEPLRENMVITLEPGIYIPEKKLGIRIEDVVVVTKDGARVLSDRLPREPDQIEKLMEKPKS
jgi:Xaa-Pro aminopeptidase